MPYDDDDLLDDDITMSMVDEEIDECDDAEEDLLNDDISDSDAIDIVMGDENITPEDFC
jgi:hypothetical protein